MRLIDADALIERLKNDNPQTSKLKWAQIVVDNAPTIDAEPVVRCKDCRHNEWCIPKQGRSENDYCSRGKRRER